jgi:Secretion system C-terminal sorting domain
MGKGDSLQFSFPMNGLYHVEAVMYLKNHSTGQTCIIIDTVHIFLRGCKTCACTNTPHLKYSLYSTLPNGHCCLLVKDTAVYTPCMIPFKWFWRLNGGTRFSTTVPYTIICDSQGAISLDVDLTVLSHDTSTLKFDTCIITKNNYDTIKSCGSGVLRRGEWMDPETGISGLLAYPIPFTDILNVRLYTEEQSELFVMLKIYDMEGKIVYLDRHVFADDVLTIDLSVLSDGIYEMQAIDDKGSTYRVKLVKGGR